MKNDLLNIQKILIFTVLLCNFLVISHIGWSQSVGDYRSKDNGDWTTLGTWERLNSLPNTWATPTTIQGYPGQNASPSLVTIRNNHSVTLNVSPTNSIGSIDIPDGNKESSLTILLKNSLIVSGAISISSDSKNDKAIFVNEGSLYVASITMNSGSTAQDAYIQISTGTVNVTNDITMNGGSGGNYLLFSGSGTLNIGGSITGGGITSAAGGGDTAPISGTVNYNNLGPQTVGNYIYNSLTLSGSGTKTFSSTTNINSNLSISSGVIANLGSYSSTANTMSIGGVGVKEGSWGSSSSDAIYKNDTYFSGPTGIITISNSTCIIPEITAMTATICSAGSFSVIPVHGTNGNVTSGTTYSWSLPAVIGITGAAAGTNEATISGTLTNTTNAAINVNYTVTPLSYGGCKGSTFTVTVTVNPDGSWTGVIDNDWNKTGNWACNQLPTNSTNVTIAGGITNYPTILAGFEGTVHNLTIENGASITVEGTLQIAGNISNGGTFTASAGTIEMKGSVSQSIGPNVFAGNVVMNLTIDNAAGVTLLGALDVMGIVTALNGNLTSGGHLTLVSTAIQTALIDGIGTGDVLGNVNIQRYLPSAFGYKYVSSPFQSATVAELAQEVVLGATFPNFYKYDENNSIDSSGVRLYRSGWVKYDIAGNSLAPLAGYAANLGADITAPAITANMTGGVNNGNLQTTLQNHNRKYTKGFNLVGNPYPSPIDWNATGWIKTNIDNALYFFNANGSQYAGIYSSYVNGVSTGNGSNVIAAMQGFFVHVSDGSYPVSGTLGVTNSVRINDLNPVFKRAVIDNRITLRFTASFEHTNAIEDAAVIYFENDANLRFDQELDALKMTNTDLLVPNIYSLTPELNKLSINGMPLPADSLSKIPLGITTFTDGWITLSADDINRLPAHLHIYLLDAETGVQRNLKQVPDYRFYLKSGQYNGRFSLVLSQSELSERVGITGKLFTLFRSGGYLSVKANLTDNTLGTLMVTNLLGQIIMHREVNGNETLEVNPTVHTGVYVITLVSGKLKHSEKVIMRKDYE